jgi:hypothetical protein
MNAANPEAPLEYDATTSNRVTCHTRRCPTAHETPCSCLAVLPAPASIPSGPSQTSSRETISPCARRKDTADVSCHVGAIVMPENSELTTELS